MKEYYRKLICELIKDVHSEYFLSKIYTVISEHVEKSKKETMNIVVLNVGKPSDVEPYIDFEKGWKFTEEDKDFLINYYQDYIDGLEETTGGDFAEEPTKILNCIKEKGVAASKDLIQADAKFSAECVNYDIYNYYENDSDVLRFIENSVLDVQW